MRRALATCAIVLLTGGCAARVPARPSGPGTPDPTAVDAFVAATRRCTGVRTVTAALRLSGRAGAERLRGTLHVGLLAPAALRVEALAPFGQPVFILAGRDNQASLLLPRENRVLRGAPVAEVLARLTGLALSAEDLRLILTGCLTTGGTPSDGRAFGRDWRAVTLASGVVAYLKQVNGQPVVVAADHGDWRVDYAAHQNDWAREVRIRSAAGDVDMTAAVGELEVNTEIDAKAFDVVVPADAAPMTLDDLRSVVPLRATS